MPYAWTTAEKEALEGRVIQLGGLVRVATPVPVRLWSGIGDLPVTGSAFDADGTIYKGGGRLISLPAFQRLWNGLAERIDIDLIAVTDDMWSAVYEEADDIRGARLRLGIVLFDENYAQIGSIKWARRGTVDVIRTSNKPGKNERVKTISFSLGSQFTGRRNPGAGAWTNADQRSRPGSEDDRACERTSLMTVNSVKEWPAF
jgi:hypothetical protein